MLYSHMYICRKKYLGTLLSFLFLFELLRVLHFRAKLGWRKFNFLRVLDFRATAG